LIRPRWYAPRRHHVPYWLVLLSVGAAVLGVLPIAAALISGAGQSAAPRSAFAAAPPGLYAVFARNEGDADAILVAPADGSSASHAIATVAHLPGYTSGGAVSPDGTRLALVTADAGTAANPVASLLLVELETGAVTRLAENIDPLQPPVWTADGASVVVTRVSGDGPSVDVDLISVRATPAGGESLAGRASNVLGAYPVGFDQDRRLLWVVIDARGSTLVRDGVELRLLAPGVTRDWRLGPDGSALAFIEVVTGGGLGYVSRQVSLNADARDQAASGAAPALGVAWAPGANQATFGREPGDGGSGALARSQRGGGFDIPLGYSPDGSVLAVQAWSGDSFNEAGEMSLTLVSGSGRFEVDATRFYGWAAR
jgi:hypothetical protein